MSIRGGICDARCQAFHTAMIQKEENTRISWFLKNQQKLLDHLEKTKKIKLEPKHVPKKQPVVDIVYNFIIFNKNYSYLLYSENYVIFSVS